MGRWYIPAQDKEISDWGRSAIAMATGAGAVQGSEPERVKQTINGIDILPLTDGGSGAGRYQAATRSITHDGSTATAEYVLAPVSVADHKALMIADIKAKAGALIAAGFTYAIPGESPADPHVYSILDRDQANMIAVQVRFGKGGTNHHGGFWRCTSNHNVTMSDAEVQAFFDAAYAYKMGIIRNAVVLSDAVQAAANASALNLIDVDAGTNDSSGGWPSRG